MNDISNEANREAKKFSSAVKSGLDRAGEKAGETARRLTGDGRGTEAHENPEGEITKRIESVTAQVPSGSFLAFAIGSIGLSAALQLSGRKADAQFIGQWVPTVLLLGLYNKIVKLQGSE